MRGIGRATLLHARRWRGAADSARAPRPCLHPYDGPADTSEFEPPPPRTGAAEELRRGRLALARLAEAERELARVRHHQDARIAALEERLGWFEENELDLREQAERRPWLGALLLRLELDR